MLNIYHIEGKNPILVRRGYFSNGILHINNKEIEMTEEEVRDRFNRGYWRCGKV